MAKSGTVYYWSEFSGSRNIHSSVMTIINNQTQPTVLWTNELMDTILASQVKILASAMIRVVINNSSSAVVDSKN